MLVHLLEAVVAPDGGGKQAAIPGYTVAGKTGTAWKATAGGYATDRYLAVFGGIAPASTPRLAAVVVIDEPGAGKYYGGEVAAPVFSGVVGGALRLLAVPPDAPIGDDDAAAQARARWPRDERRRRRVSPVCWRAWPTLPRDVEISDLTQDGRAAQPGCAFLAMHGTQRARPQVRAAGRGQRRARGVVGAGAGGGGAGPAVADRGGAGRAHLREHASTIADRFFGAPSRALSVAGITGTNGKTTCAYLLAQALEAAGRPAAYMGTIGTGRPRALAASALTTGDAVTVQRTLAGLQRRRRGQRGHGSFLARHRPVRASARCASAPPRSPISRAIISTITAAWTATAPPRRGCSRVTTSCRASSTSTTPSAA